MNGQPLRILHLTDPHLHASRDALMRGVNTDASLEATLARVRGDSRRPDLVLATGDLVQDESRAGYERFRELMKPLGVPVYCLPGNHDAPPLMQETLNDGPFQYCGQAVHGPWALVMLSTVVSNDDGGVLTSRELGFLDQALDGTTAAHVLIALHHHPVPMGSRWLDSVALRNAPEFFAIVDRYPAVRGIVWGHVHQTFDRQRGGVRLMSTPSTCAQFRPGSDSFALDVRPPGFRWIDLQADGRIESTVVWVE